ncbi:hypothetical protein [Luteimonas terrae]|jgi:hypothetical protein|uniref:Uncharacterized protein n=1 Tax=Luteimonas terrae TaxID=1530191 RepID=A0A4R5U5Z9_9GAMM|nr:hypothetical protein [Luteimonas terrae]TDK29484.1 hypothetical protein E2F49_14000 [Luteimonas terrae]
MTRRLFRLLPALFVLSGVLLLAACQRGDADKALIEAPAVGDVYAAELSAFSDYEFTDEDNKPIDPAYGLLKVVAADADGVVVITENAASAEKSVSRSDIRGDLSTIEFDESEQIRIGKADLVKAHTDGLIYVVKRPDAK